MSQESIHDTVRAQILDEFRRKGGESTLAKYGPEHYSRMGKKSQAKRKAKRQAAPIDPSLQNWIDAINKGVHD